MENNSGTDWRTLLAFGGLVGLVPVLALPFESFLYNSVAQGSAFRDYLLLLQSYCLPVKGNQEEEKIFLMLLSDIFLSNPIFYSLCPMKLI